MAAANFSLASIIPEYDTFTDTDGTVYNVRTIKMLSSFDLAQLTRFQTTTEALARPSNGETPTPEVLEQGMVTLTDAVNTFWNMIIPDLAIDRIQAIELAYKLSFMEWWQRRQNEIQPAPPPNRTARRAAQSSSRRSSSRA